MSVIKALQGTRSPLMDQVMYALTFLGDPMILMLLAGTVVFAVSRNLGVKMTLALLAAILTYSSIKLFVGDPRPYHLDSEVGVVTAMGFGFPSGHATVATVFWAGLALWSGISRRTALWVTALAAITIVGMTRMYLGLHFPADVIGGLALGFAVLTLAGWIVRLGETDGWPHVSKDRSATRLVIVGALIVATLSILLSADLKNALLMGLLSGILLGLSLAKPERDDGHRYHMGGTSVMKRITIGLAVLFLVGWIAIAGAFMGGVIEIVVPTVAAMFGGLWLTLLAPRAFLTMGLSTQVIPPISRNILQ